MTAWRRPRVLVLAAALVVVLAGGLVAWQAFDREPARAADAPRPTPAAAVATTSLATVEDVPHLVFRSTAPGDGYGLVALAALDNPAGPRALTDVACDRVYAAGGTTSCLRTVRGATTTFEAAVYDAGWHRTATWPLPGVPSRTRVSADGTLVATTSFVTGDAYAPTGFSTVTEVHGPGGSTSGNLEDFTLLVDGKPAAPPDRNVWGVTFVDDTTFYATVQSKQLGTTWLVRGDLHARTLVTVADGVECPSLSPDGTRIAYKSNVGAGGTTHWTPAVLDLATGVRTLLVTERRSIDDQIAWLDDDTILYGMPRDDGTPATDVWSVDLTHPDAAPAVLVPFAWSPAVVQP